MPKVITSPSNVTVSRLFVLELNAGRIHTMNTDGSDRTTIVTGCHLPDGIVVDVEARHIYWTNMGIPNLNDGSIERADIDGKNRRTIVAQGDTHTPKQIILDKEGGKLYWCDREGMRVMRCNLDGSKLETLIEVGRGEADSRDATRWCVGLTIDPKFGHIYWSQKGPDNAGLGRISRANVEIPAGQTAATRSDIEIFYDGLPEPIDLELDHKKQARRKTVIACQTALAKRGVAVLIVPADISASVVDDRIPYAVHVSRPVTRPNDADLSEIADILNNSENVVLYGGSGCQGAHQEILAVANKLKAPIAHTSRAKDFLEFDNPYNIGMTGILGNEAGYHALLDCDALLMLGADFAWRQFYPEGKDRAGRYRPDPSGTASSDHEGRRRRREGDDGSVATDAG